MEQEGEIFQYAGVWRDTKEGYCECTVIKIKKKRKIVYIDLLTDLSHDTDLK